MEKAQDQNIINNHFMVFCLTASSENFISWATKYSKEKTTREKEKEREERDLGKIKEKNLLTWEMEKHVLPVYYIFF